jgi:ElaB/YqjD/DUF883 family membrane-anchored ribosome-binding protein
MNISSEGDNDTKTETSEMREAVSSDIEQIKRLGEERLDDLRELGGQLRRRVEDEVKNRPFVALGVAFGAGALVSSIMSSRLARLGILAVGGYAAREMFGDRLMEVLAPDEEGESPRPRRQKSRGERQARGESR